MTRKTFYIADDLKIKIEKLLKRSDNSLNSQSREILKLVYEQVESFEEPIKITLVTDLDKAMRWEVYELRDIVAQIGSVQFSEEEYEEEYNASNVEEEDDDDDEEDSTDKGEEEEEVADGPVQWSADELENLKQRIHSFNRWLTMIKESCVDGLYNFFPGEEEDDEDDDHGGAVTSNMIGLLDVYDELKYKLMNNKLTSVVGMPGIGKTTIANKIFNDRTILKYFDHRVWVRVGKRCPVKDIARRILEKIVPDIALLLAGVDGEAVEEAVHLYLKARLRTKCYLIVLDDVWDSYITYNLHPYYRYETNELDHPFLHSESYSRILLTSRLQQLNKEHAILTMFDCIVTMRLLYKDESWDLLCGKVFCKPSSCPPQLEKAGKRISENCEGLPLTILTVARLLSEEKKSTLGYWNEVAAKKNHPLFIKAYDEISKVLLPSYTYLPPLLKKCFLFIGLFPQNYEIPRSKLINLWRADRFLELHVNINSVSNTIYCLEELVTNSITMVYKQSTHNLIHTVKTCGLHSSLWHLSKQKTRETKFAFILTSPDDCLGDGMKGHHRLSIHNNVLLAMKDVHKLVEDNCASTSHSFLCFGPYHQYQVPLCFRMKLPKELDALSIRFYEFPMEVLQLVLLSYLSLTLDGKIPASISQLQSLEFFIVDQHQRIKSCMDASYLPVEIWSLSKLKLLQAMGSDLPDPCGASLDKLITLTHVSAHSCTEAVLKGVPCLRELSIRIELAPGDDGKHLRCFDHISHLTLLKLKCVIVNPEVVPPVVPFLSIPGKHLMRVSLSGLGYPWEELNKMATLPFLQGLKLKNYAFYGPKWEVEETGFAQLFSFVIEDTDLEDWKFGCGAFRTLLSLRIKHCYALEKIHGEFGKGFHNVVLVDCNPLCVAEMEKAIPEEANLYVYSSWEHRKKLIFGSKIRHHPKKKNNKKAI